MSVNSYHAAQSEDVEGAVLEWGGHIDLQRVKFHVSRTLTVTDRRSQKKGLTGGRGWSS